MRIRNYDESKQIEVVGTNLIKQQIVYMLMYEARTSTLKLVGRTRGSALVANGNTQGGLTSLARYIRTRKK